MHDKKLLVSSIMVSISVFLISPILDFPILGHNARLIHYALFFLLFHIFHVSSFFYNFVEKKTFKLVKYAFLGYFVSLLALIPVLAMQINKTAAFQEVFFKALQFTVFFLLSYPIFLCGWLYGAIFYIIYFSKQNDRTWKKFVITSGILLFVAAVFRTILYLFG